MSDKNKFGAFSGVFTPSILTILGVIMYMRMGWVVGNAGLIGTIIIVVIAHVISISTGLSLSSIATDKKVGAGGIYYILSRSMGIPIGGAIGVTLYIGTAFSIALYLIGFAESFNGYFGFDTSINGLRIAGSIALLLLTVIALISTSFALKTQFFILAAIVISLVSIGFGTNEFAPQSVALFASEKSVPLEVVFAIFFPAVTGFTAGVAMSGDLKDPKKSLPIGTIAAIAVGFVVYIGLAFFLSYYIDSETLRSDYNILMKIALWSPAVVAGIWGATLSSALGGILGGPRILQAMSIDKVTPKLFGKGKGQNNEPVNALILVFVIAQAGILIGELDVIARVVSMFYLAAYGFINLSFFLESWANPDFQPSFKVNRWFGLLGFLASFGIMFKLDMLAMFGAIVIIIGIYLLLQRKQLALETGDVWQSVWENIVAKGLKKLDTKENDTSANWNPNIILFSGESAHRKYLLQLSDTIAGRTGIVTNFKLILDKNNTKPFKKSEQVLKENSFKDLGMFSRQVKVDNIFKGIENIASTFGFSGVEPNTVMMGWPRKLNKSGDYTSMTQTLLHLDYNLLYLDFDQKAKFGKKSSVDLWWRETDSKNAEMMLNIVRFITQSTDWNRAKIRVLYVNHNNTDSSIIKSKITKFVEDLRVNVEIVVINNGVEQKPFYKIIAIQSANTDLTLLGIPNIKTEKQADFIVNTTQLFNTIGSTLMVKASNNFNELKFDVNQESNIELSESSVLKPLPLSENNTINSKVGELDAVLNDTLNSFSEQSLRIIASSYSQFISEISQKFDDLSSALVEKNEVKEIIPYLQSFSKELIATSESFKENKLSTASESLYKELNKLQKVRYDFIENEPKNISFKTNRKVKWKAILNFYFIEKITPNLQKSLYQFGAQNFVMLSSLTEGLVKETQLFVENTSANNKQALATFVENSQSLIKTQLQTAQRLKSTVVDSIQQFERDQTIELLNNIEKPNFFKKIQNTKNKASKKDSLAIKNNVAWFGTNWYKNQLLCHNQTEMDWLLTDTGLLLSNINENIKNHLTESMINPQLEKIKILSKIDAELRKGEEKNLDKQTIDALIEIAEGISSVNLSNLFEDEEKSITQLTQKTNRIVSLMNPTSFNVLSEKQNDSEENIQINLATVQNHIIQANYLGTLQESINELEELYNQNSEGIYNTANKLIYLIDETSIESKGTKQLKNEVQENIAINLSNLRKLKDIFLLDLKTNLHQTQDLLTIRVILESTDLLDKSAQKTVLTSKFTDWKQKKTSDFGILKKQIKTFVNQQQQELDNQLSKDFYKGYANKIEQTYSFLQEQRIDKEVSKILPFYYKKLFTGSHLVNTSIEERPEYLKGKDALKRLESGVNGAIMIIGDALSGKTFLSDAIARIPEKSVKYDINPPANQTYTNADLHKVFQKLFNKKGTSLSILKQIKPAVFVFNDLEKWWTRSENGVKTLNHLTSLIEKMGDKHTFILNANRYSYGVIKQTTQLEKQLITTIIMRPYSKLEINSIILNRHKVGGASIYYKNELVRNSKKINKIISKLQILSEGSIGVSLQKWLPIISLNKENELSISEPVSTKMPKIFNAEWKVLLYAFVLHNNLSEAQVKILFNDESNHFFKALEEMEKGTLVTKQADARYILNNSARFFIEKHLKSLSII